MKKAEVIETIALHYGYVRKDFPLPGEPVLTKMEKSYCPQCNVKVLMLSEKRGFQPAHFVCPNCKKVSRVGGG